MRMNIRKGLLAEIYSGLAKLLSHSGHGAPIESVPGRVRAVGTGHGETLVYQAESPECLVSRCLKPQDGVGPLSKSLPYEGRDFMAPFPLCAL